MVSAAQSEVLDAAHTPEEQTPLRQSLPPTQALPPAQGKQPLPPQSSAVSSPLTRLSWQAFGAVGASGRFGQET
jgi:hypothetical protein